MKLGRKKIHTKLCLSIMTTMHIPMFGDRKIWDGSISKAQWRDRVLSIKVTII